MPLRGKKSIRVISHINYKTLCQYFFHEVLAARVPRHGNGGAFGSDR
jgi:hypothetical protein